MFSVYFNALRNDEAGNAKVVSGELGSYESKAEADAIAGAAANAAKYAPFDGYYAFNARVVDMSAKPSVNPEFFEED